jgi:hypothetical protein
MVKSINVYFDAWVDKGGPFRRLAMGHTFGSMAQLLAMLVFLGVGSVCLPGTVGNMLVLFCLPFFLMMANRTNCLQVIRSEKVTWAPKSTQFS